MEVCTKFLRCMNKSLVYTLPFSHAAALEQKSICYLGNNGEDDINNVTFCEDMPDGMTVGQVAHWYLTPERHVIEFITATAVSLLVIRIILSKLPAYPESNNNEKSDKSPSFLRPPLPLRIITAIFCAMNIFYKSNGYPGKIYFLSMPCHVNWAMALILCFYPNLSSHVSNILCQIWIGMTGLTITAIALPDLTDLTLPFEVPFFFLHHAVLLIYPLYYLASGKITLLPLPPNNDVINNTNHNNIQRQKQKESAISCFLKWFILSCASFVFFYVTMITPLSIHTGLNLNYMLSPPPTPGSIIAGPNYRLQSGLCVAIVFFVMRLLGTCIEFLIRYIISCPFQFHASTTTSHIKSKNKIV